MLRADVAPVPALGRELSEAMYRLFERHYEDTDPERFRRDLSEKQWVLLFYDQSNLVGFSTQRVIEARDAVSEKRLRVLFSGDTVIDRAHWGSQSLMKEWCRFSGSLLALAPETPLYWFLLSKGHRTYLYLPLFFLDFHPSRRGARDVRLPGLLRQLARERYGAAFDEASGCVHSQALQERLRAELNTTSLRQGNPDVVFFAERNPRHAEGVELACLARIAPDNLRGVARRDHGFPPPQTPPSLVLMAWPADMATRAAPFDSLRIDDVGDDRSFATSADGATVVTLLALKERIDLEFDPTIKEGYGVEENVSIDLWVKNVEKLIVKVFEINGRFSGTTPLRMRAGFNEVEMTLRHVLMGEKIVQPKVQPMTILRHLEETIVPSDGMVS